MSGDRTWSDAMIVRLRELWADPANSSAAIGRVFGVSKNAVVGKAHRLGLPARPSPIRRPGENAAPRSPRPRPAPRQTLPSLAPAAVVVQTPIAVVAVLPVVAPTIVRIVQAAVPAPVAKPPRRSAECCWPIGDPGTRSFRFCESIAVISGVYCADHAQVAYVRIRDRREATV